MEPLKYEPHPAQLAALESLEYRLTSHIPASQQRLNMRAVMWKLEALYWKNKYEEKQKRG